MRTNLTFRLLKRILTDELTPGQQLGSEAELRRELEASRASIRESISELICYGLVVINRGKDTRILDWRLNGSFELLLVISHLRSGTEEGPELIRQLLWLRRIVYVSIAALLPTDPESVESIQTSIGHLHTHNHFGCSWKAVKTHAAAEEKALCDIARHTGNLPLIMLTQAFRRCLELVLMKTPRGEELVPAVERFAALPSLLRTNDRAGAAALLGELCDLRADTYLRLVAPPAEDDQSYPFVELRRPERTTGW